MDLLWDKTGTRVEYLGNCTNDIRGISHPRHKIQVKVSATKNVGPLLKLCRSQFPPKDFGTGDLGLIYKQEYLSHAENKYLHEMKLSQIS